MSTYVLSLCCYVGSHITIIITIKLQCSNIPLLRLKVIINSTSNIQKIGRLKSIKEYGRGIWSKDEDFPVLFCLVGHRSATSYTHTYTVQEEQRCKMLSFLLHMRHITRHRVQINNVHLCFSFTLYISHS
jgi:hypothetical protein